MSDSFSNMKVVSHKIYSNTHQLPAIQRNMFSLSICLFVLVKEILTDTLASGRLSAIQIFIKKWKDTHMLC